MFTKTTAAIGAVLIVVALPVMVILYVNHMIPLGRKVS